MGSGAGPGTAGHESTTRLSRALHAAVPTLQKCLIRLAMAMQAPDPFSSSSLSLPTQLWSGGPSPGTLYHFPGRGNHSSAAEGPITRTL